MRQDRLGGINANSILPIDCQGKARGLRAGNGLVAQMHAKSTLPPRHLENLRAPCYRALVWLMMTTRREQFGI